MPDEMTGLPGTAYHPSGDPKNMKELMNTALLGKLKK